MICQTYKENGKTTLPYHDLTTAKMIGPCQSTKSPNDIAKVVIPRSGMKEGGKVKGKISWKRSVDSDGLRTIS